MWTCGGGVQQAEIPIGSWQGGAHIKLIIETEWDNSFFLRKIKTNH
jgi:hypothetical protein